MNSNLVKYRDAGDGAPAPLNTLTLKRSMSMSDSHSTLPPLPTQDGVEFRHIPDWLGYCVGSDGSVWSCKKQGRYGGFAACWRPRNLWPGSKGYLLVGLRSAGKNRMAKVHQLVLEAFRGPRPAKAESRHLDSIRTNNEVGNLAWCTSSENRQDMIRRGTHNLQKLSNQEVREIRRLARTVGNASLAKRFGITRDYVRALCKKLYRKHA